MEAHVIESIKDLERYSAGWQLLDEQASLPTQHFIWARALAEVYGPELDLVFVVIGSPDRPVAAAPMVRRGSVVPQLEFLGVRELYEPMDFAYSDAAAVRPLAERLAALGLPVVLARLPSHSPTVRAVKTAYDGRGLVISRPLTESPYIRLDESWTTPEKKLNAGRRSDLRRARRIAERAGSVSIEIVSPTPAQAPAVVADAVRVEHAGWKGEQGTSLARQDQRRSLFETYSLLAARRSILRVCFLRIGSSLAAMQLAVECNNRFFLLKIGYDARFRRSSPGTLLMWETLRYAARRGLKSYEFLGQTEPWTRVWARGTRADLTLKAYPLRPRGIGALAVDLGRAVDRRVRTALRRRT